MSVVACPTDERPALLSCLACSRTLSHGVDLAELSLADLFAGSSTITDRNSIRSIYIRELVSDGRLFVLRCEEYFSRYCM